MTTTDNALVPQTVLSDAMAAEQRLQHRSASALLIVGASGWALDASLTAATSASLRDQLLASAGLGLFGAAVCALHNRRLNARLIPPVTVVLLAALVAVSDPLGAGALSLLIPIIWAAYFSPQWLTGASLVLMSAALAAALAINSTASDRVDTWFSAVVISALVAGLVSSIRTREHRLRDALAHVALTDALTGVANRRGLIPHLERRLSRATAENSPLVVALVDIDHFKSYNDTHGHLAGDEALVRTARALTGCARAVDFVARFGGEEFAVVLPLCDLEGAHGYLDRVAARMSAQRDTHPAVSISAGIVAYGQEHDAALLLARADEALYAAKRAGRCRTGWHHDGEIVTRAFQSSPVSAS